MNRRTRRVCIQSANAVFAVSGISLEALPVSGPMSSKRYRGAVESILKHSYMAIEGFKMSSLSRELVGDKRSSETVTSTMTCRVPGNYKCAKRVRRACPCMHRIMMSAEAKTGCSADEIDNMFWHITIDFPTTTSFSHSSHSLDFLDLAYFDIAAVQDLLDGLEARWNWWFANSDEHPLF